MTNLRWLERNASSAGGRKEKVLQYRWCESINGTLGSIESKMSEWNDVPTVQEPPAPKALCEHKSTCFYHIDPKNGGYRVAYKFCRDCGDLIPPTQMASEPPRAPREFTIEIDPMNGQPKRVWLNEGFKILEYTGDKPKMEMLIKVREVLDDK